MQAERRPEPMVRVVGAKCEKCGAQNDKVVSLIYGESPFIAPVQWAREGLVHLLEGEGRLVPCGGRILIATEPVEDDS